MERQIFRIEIDNLKLSKFNESIYGDEPVDENLAESIRRNGQITPLLVQQDNVIISGSRRYKALKHIGATHAECEILLNAGPDECKLLTIEANRNRKKTADQVLAEVREIVKLHDVSALQMQKQRGILERPEPENAKNPLFSRNPHLRVTGKLPTLTEKVMAAQGCSEATANRRIAKAKAEDEKPENPRTYQMIGTGKQGEKRAKAAYGTLCRLLKDDPEAVEWLKAGNRFFQ